MTENLRRSHKSFICEIESYIISLLPINYIQLSDMIISLIFFEYLCALLDAQHTKSCQDLIHKWDIQQNIRSKLVSEHTAIYFGNSCFDEFCVYPSLEIPFHLINLFKSKMLSTVPYIHIMAMRESDMNSLIFYSLKWLE